MIIFPKPTLFERLKTIQSQALDWVFNPIISKLTSDEYFQCRTRLDCVKKFISNHL